MNEPSTERIFSLEEIDYARFWGQNDKLLEFLKHDNITLNNLIRGRVINI